MQSVSPRTFWQTFIVSSILLSVLAICQTVQQVSALDIILWRSKWILLVGVFALNILTGAFGLRQLSLASSDHWIEKLEFDSTIILGRWFGFILVVFGFALTWVVRLFFYGNILPQLTPIFWVFIWASLIQSLGLKLITHYKWHTLFAVTILMQGLIYQIYGHLSIVSNYPFSIGYSEASRHYYASLFFAKSLYAVQIPLPYLHPTRYFLMSLPFLYEGLPLWFHRLWQALLWIGLTAASSTLLVRRLTLKGWMSFIVAAWVFLYFLQGAVYYHLQVCVILILAGVSARRPWRSLLFVIPASIWSGASRVNWFPVPAMLAIAIYLLETSIQKKGWRYWLPPLIWGVSGLVAAIVSQFIYISISGNADIHTFGSSFTSTLIWDRLLPNDTFPLGILLGITIVSAPLVIATIQMAHGKFSHLHPLRWLALLAMLFMLFLGGLIVSVKIGGGADLHNMDAFLVLLALITVSFFTRRVTGEHDLNPAWGQIHWSVMAAVLLIPLGFALPQIGFLPRHDQVMAQKDIRKLQSAVADVAANGGEVLFVTERQLLTFEKINNVSLVPEYEQIELMEMAMSGNREYLEHFYSDLKDHRFEIIIAEEQKFTQQKKGSFIEENNAWVRYIGAPLLCAYKPIETLFSTNVQIFVPRPAPPSCKDPFSE
jgi:hypothetical protein